MREEEEEEETEEEPAVEGEKRIAEWLQETAIDDESLSLALCVRVCG